MVGKTLTKDLIIKNQLGLHARASNKLATLSSKFESNVEIIYNDEKVDALEAGGSPCYECTSRDEFETG